MRTIVALYDDFVTAQNAAQELIASGFDRSHVSLVASDQSGEYSQYIDDPDATPVTIADDTTAVGAGAGAVIGGLGGLLVGLGALAIPGIGPIIAAGPLVSTLAGAGVGAMAGGLVGALTSLGIPETEAGYYAEGLRRGGALITAQVPEDKVEQAMEVLDRHEPVDIEERVGQWQDEGWTGYDPQAQPYTAAGLDEERADYRAEGAAVDDEDQFDDDYAVYEAGYRQHYQTNYVNSGYPYEQYAPAYRYGFDLAVHPSYSNYDWAEVEPAAWRSWEETNPGTWEQFKHAVRHGWEEVKEAIGFDNDDDYESEDELARDRVKNHQY